MSDSKSKSLTEDNDCSISEDKDFYNNQTDFTLNITGLLPFTTYSVCVTAVTRCQGALKSNESTTDEDSKYL